METKPTWKIIIQDTYTDKHVAFNEDTFTNENWWSEGNGACDCNRSIYYGKHSSVVDYNEDDSDCNNYSRRLGVNLNRFHVCVINENDEVEHYENWETVADQVLRNVKLEDIPALMVEINNEIASYDGKELDYDDEFDLSVARDEIFTLINVAKVKGII